MPFFIPLVSLIACFLLTSKKEKINFGIYKHIYFIFGFGVLVSSEIAVRYSGISYKHAAIYYLIPIIFLPLIYLTLIKKFKYENLN